MSEQNTVTIIVEINPVKLDDLKLVLGKIKEKVYLNEKVAFEIPGTIHYCRWVIMEQAEFRGQIFPLKLAYSGNFDGVIATHIKDLSSNALAVFIDDIYSLCDDYPDTNSRTPETKEAFFNRWMVAPLAFYAGAPGRDLTQIKQESALRNYLRNFLDRTGNPTSARELHQQIKTDITSNPEFAWIKTGYTLPARNWPALILMGLVLICLIPVIIPWILILQIFHENKDLPLGISPSQVDESRINKLEQYEDLEYQNQFTQVLEMKPGIMRLVTLKVFMVIAKLLIKILFIENNLMGIPTIHFAKWLLMDGQKRMLFVSNFDGSWQQYLGDFIDKSGWGLTAIWSNTMGFPKTLFLILKGAYDAEHFLAWSRYYQIQTQVWYSAYPNLSIKNIVNNSHIRVNVLKDLNEKEATQFLARI